MLRIKLKMKTKTLMTDIGHPSQDNMRCPTSSAKSNISWILPQKKFADFFFLCNKNKNILIFNIIH